MDAQSWEIKAAREIETLLGDAVEKNTDKKFGYFTGVSVRDVAECIRRNMPRRKAERIPLLTEKDVSDEVKKSLERIRETINGNKTKETS